MIAIVGVLIVLILVLDHTSPAPQLNSPTPLPKLIVPAKTSGVSITYTQAPKTLRELLDLPAGDLDQVDIARMNLLCAERLPGADALEIEHALKILDRWAERVTIETDRHLYRVHDPRYAAHYRNSEAVLRAEMLLQVLQVDLGIKYDMSAVGNFSFQDSRVAFLHGMIPTKGQIIADTPGGTCASMPVMYVAVGRRLGYPLKLVTTDSHVFVRWDGRDFNGTVHPNPKWRERFNIEGAGEGFNSFPDDYYKSWPVKITEIDVRINGYLKSLTPMEELALFLGARGHCGRDAGQNEFAARCYENAHRYDPTQPVYRAWFVEVARWCNYKSVTPELERLLTTRLMGIPRRHPTVQVDGVPRAIDQTITPPVANILQSTSSSVPEANAYYTSPIPSR